MQKYYFFKIITKRIIVFSQSCVFLYIIITLYVSGETCISEMKKHYIELLEHYRNNQLSKDELIALFDWINSPEGKVEYEQYLSDQLDTLNEYEDYQIPVNPELILKRIKKRTPFRKTGYFNVHKWWRYAAILLIGLLIGNMTWLINLKSGKDGENIVFAVSKGNKGTLVLPDGSKIWLNAESKITYTGGGKQRIITMEGESYLQVAKDKKHPFIVNTPFASIIAYGTEFNVAAYPADSILKVSLVEGSVGIKIAGQNDITRMVPEQVAVFDARNGKMELYNRDLSDVALWRKDKLVLTNANTLALCSKMESWYGVSIQLSNQPVKNHLYNMTIRNESIEETLELINKLTPVIYNIQNKEVIIKYIKKKNTRE